MSRDRSGRVGVGVIGAGDVCDQYLVNLVRYQDLEVVFVADRHPERAAAKASRFSISRSGTPARLLADDDVELVVNLTTPASHADVALAALAAGRHVWNEKPLAASPAAARRILADAGVRGLRVGAAPDAFLGAKFRAARRLIAGNAIGTPRTALTIARQPGPESWHPSPEFLFQAGGGPLMDGGPYQVAALVQLFGPVREVAAVADTARPARTIAAGPRAGTTFEVEVPTHVSALLTFGEGRSAQTLLSFDSALADGRFDVTGTLGVLELGDIGRFSGPLRLRTLAGEDRAVEAPGAEWERGLGVLDLARAIRAGTPAQASGEFAAHVLDVLDAVHRAAVTREWVAVSSTYTAPPALPDNWDPRQRTLAP